MQPSPIAETSNSLFPSLRFCMCFLLDLNVRLIWPGPVLLVSDVLHPLHRLAVECLSNGDMAHRRGRRRAVPVLLAGQKPDDIARPDFLDWASLALHPSAA